MSNEIMVGIIVGIVTCCVTWFISQSTSGRRVMKEVEKWREDMNKVGLTLQRHEGEIERMRDTNIMTRKEISELRGETASQIRTMAVMVEKVLDTANNLVEIVRVQNELLRAQHTR